MQLSIRKMTEKYAIEILCWKYEKPYDFYNQVLTSDAIMELLTNKYYVTLDEYEQLIGFFCVGKSAKVPAGERNVAYKEDFIDVGIGMKPEFTGKGKGLEFFSNILRFIEENYRNSPIRLTVAEFNERAIHLYEKLNFVKKTQFQRGKTIYIVMVREKIKADKKGKIMKEKQTFETTDEYIRQFPPEVQEKLNTLRGIIKELVPEAQEKISYQMPTFALYGNIIHFAAYKNHIGLYPGASGIAAFQKELVGYKTSKGTVQIPIGDPLPAELIRKIVKFKVEENIKKAEARGKK
ncbi:GNAT family N-acetyltransferase [Oceanobacillus chungangensis]|uniref:GNAT family N-acetyltransferase n=1 Tax=Oceanobacillus chungangensis TaxID=1229152 RepID=UPI0026BE4CF5